MKIKNVISNSCMAKELLMIKFPGGFNVKKLKSITFIYVDDSMDVIEDPRAAQMFQSRCNSSGILSGMEDYLVSKDEIKPETNP
jgi:hypothetical protein